jgi:magnesium transporter
MANNKKHKSKLSGLVSQISFHPDKRVNIFLGLSLDDRTILLLMLTHPIKRDILIHIPEDDLIALLEKVDPDDATDLLQLLGHRKRQKTLERLSFDLKDTVSELLKFDPETAAGLMNVDYIQVDISDSIADVAKKFKLHEKRTGRLPVILATDNERLVGFLPGHELGFVRTNEKIGKYTKRIPSIHHAASHDEVMELFRSHPHNKVAVLGDNNNVVGIIYSDDVLKLIQDRESSSLYDFAGVSAEEGVADSTKRKVKFRYKWLIINLATAFLAALTVSQFEETISKYVLLAVYMPIVAGMGGNAATQTLAVMVRGIALRQIADIKTVLKTLKSEAGAGFINGLINGFLVAFIVLIKDNEPAIALILALAMVINLLVAGVFGTMVPILMSRLHKDPAASATVFITTATDVFGFLAFLGLATLILA